jgi:cyclopropane fatty-acyl-phospholipid synthase-like methyltransferase
MRSEHCVLDLGCGDGSFANQVLSSRFSKVHGVDFSHASVSKACADSPSTHTTFDTMDLVDQDIRRLGEFDGIFMIGILHHVKSRASEIMRAARDMARRVVVLEPNGAHLVRKLLELTPAYRAAGEDSFRHGQLVRIFGEAGFRIVEHRRTNLFPNQMPGWGFRLLRPAEAWIERTPVLRGMCTLNAYALRHGDD